MNNDNSKTPQINNNDNSKLPTVLHNESATQNVVADEILSKKLTLIDRVFPDKETKEAIKYKVSLIQQQASSKLEEHRMTNEFFRQVLEESYNTILRKGKEINRKDQAERGAILKTELDAKITQLTINYFQQNEQFEKQALTIESETKRQMLLGMIDQRLSEFKDTVDILMSEFKSIYSEGV